MAKRFTETEKWKDDWYLSLDNDTRIIYQWLIDNCNHAGIIKKEVTMLNYCCHTHVGVDDIPMMFPGRVYDCETFFFIPGFIKHQYPTGLTSDKPVVKSARSILEKNVSFPIIKQSLGNHCETVKEKDKEKEMDIDSSSEGVIGETSFDEIWELYPEKDGRKSALRHFMASVKTEEDFELIKKALDNYLDSKKVKCGFIKNGSTWFNNWRDWIDYSEEEEKPKSEYDIKLEAIRKAPIKTP